jgi:tetratricopeptide (TPR) repeat protein/serine/threonine protein kinase
LGRGGCGEVWKATGPGGFPVAMKFVRLGDQAAAVELRSLDLMKQLRHANLLSVFGAWQNHDLLIIAMELGERTLLDRLQEAVKKQKLPGVPLAELFDCMRDAARGIDYLNGPRPGPDGQPGQGVQHRDIKPANLLLVGGSVKVADFGLAKLLNRSVVSNTGHLTVGYAAPESFRGKTSGRSDQYSLAVTYCHLRANRLPFMGDAAKVMIGHMSLPPDLTMLPEAERPVVARALAKEPDARWPSCRAFVQALADAAAPSAVVPAPRAKVAAPAPAHLETRTTHENRTEPIPDSVPAGRRPTLWPWLTGAAVLLVLLAVQLGMALVNHPDPSKEEDNTRQAAVGPDRADKPRGKPDKDKPRDDPAKDKPRVDPPKGKPVDHLTPGREAVDKGDWDRALELLDKAVAADPSPEAYYQRGRAWAGKKDRAKALDDWTQALKLRPDFAAALRDRADAYVGLRRWDEAVTDAKEAIRLDGTDKLAYCHLARAHLGNRQPQMAQDAATEAIKIDANFALAYFLRGRARVALLNSNDALEDFSKGLELDPRDAGALTSRANLYFNKQEYNKAIKDCTDALALDDRDYSAYFIRGRARIHLGTYDKAIEDYDAALRLNPNDPAAYNNRGLAYYHDKQYDKALTDYTAAIRRDSRRALYYFNRANVYKAQKQYDKAIEDYTKIIGFEPGNAVAWRARGNAHLLNKDKDKADSDFKEADRLTGKVPAPAGG